MTAILVGMSAGVDPDDLTALARSVGANLTAPVEGHDEVHFH